MFQPPAIEPKESLLLASEFLKSANEFIAQCIATQTTQFQAFWYPQGRLRSVAEVNAILAEMDRVSPGQSAKYFAAANQLASLILSVVPDALVEPQWMPPYDYTVDPVTYSLRVK